MVFVISYFGWGGQSFNICWAWKLQLSQITSRNNTILTWKDHLGIRLKLISLLELLIMIHLENIFWNDLSFRALFGYIFWISNFYHQLVHFLTHLLLLVNLALFPEMVLNTCELYERNTYHYPYLLTQTIIICIKTFVC